MTDMLPSELREADHRLEAALADAVLLVERVGDAVLRPERAEASRLCEEGARLKRRCREIEIELIGLTARTGPAGPELAVVVATIQIAQHAALVANQFGLIGDQLLHADGGVHDRRGTAERVSSMAFLAAAQLGAAAVAYARREGGCASRLERQDDRIDRLNRDVFAVAQELEVSPRRRELALRHVLIARSLERIGDNAVKIAEQAAILAGGPSTGEPAYAESI